MIIRNTSHAIPRRCDLFALIDSAAHPFYRIILLQQLLVSCDNEAGNESLHLVSLRVLSSAASDVVATISRDAHTIDPTFARTPHVTPSIPAGTWGSILAGTGLYLYKREIPFQLKIISARILAQAGLIVGALSIAGVSLYTAREQAAAPATSNWKLRDFSEPVQQRPSAKDIAQLQMAATPTAAASAAALK